MAKKEAAQEKSKPTPDKKTKCAVCLPDFQMVFQKVSPSTVGIAAGRKVDGRFKVRRSGSGFVWDDRGHIVTNAHLVAESTEVRVRRRDGKVMRGRIVGLDIGTDLAVINVASPGLRPVDRGQIDGLQPGQWVAAIGNPHGMEHSITVGVISAVGRRNLPGHKAKYAEFIQSDVAIFPGNSGGPLVDTQGRVIGLNTAILGQGLSFSTHIDMVKTVVQRLLTQGRFDRGFAGLYVQRVSFRAAELAGQPSPIGALVKGVVADGPADRAGLQPGDIILRYGDRKIQGAASLPWLIAATLPETAVTLSIRRRQESMTLSVTVSRAD